MFDQNFVLFSRLPCDKCFENQFNLVFNPALDSGFSSTISSHLFQDDPLLVGLLLEALPKQEKVS